MLNTLPILLFDKNLINETISQTLTLIPAINRSKQAILLSTKKYRLNIEHLVSSFATILMLAKSVESDQVFNQMVKEVNFKCKDKNSYEFITVMVNDSVVSAQKDNIDHVKFNKRVEVVLSDFTI